MATELKTVKILVALIPQRLLTSMEGTAQITPKHTETVAGINAKNYIEHFLLKKLVTCTINP